MGGREERRGLAEAGERNKVTVFIATPAPDFSYNRTRGSHWRLEAPPGSERWQMSGMRSEYARTTAINHFLIDTKHDYLLLLDSDMDPERDALMRLLEHRKDIVTAFYFFREQPPFPVIREDYDAQGDEWPSPVFYDFPRDALFRVGSTGFGFLLIHRSVFYGLKPLFVAAGRALGIERGLSWAYYGAWRGEHAGGDLIFCDLCKLAGYDIWCDSSVFVRHLAPGAVGLEHYDPQAARDSGMGGPTEARHGEEEKETS